MTTEENKDYATIPSKWISWHPTSRMDAGYWLEVSRRLGESFTDDDVKRVIAEVEADSRQAPRLGGHAIGEQ